MINISGTFNIRTIRIADDLFMIYMQMKVGDRAYATSKAITGHALKECRTPEDFRINETVRAAAATLAYQVVTQHGK